MVIILLLLLLLIICYFRWKRPKIDKKIIYIVIFVLLFLVSLRFGQFVLPIIGALALFLFNILRRLLLNNYFLYFLGRKLHHIFNGKSNSREKVESAAKMSKKEAAEILGVDPDDAKEKILSQYKELMKRNHPDKGGSKKIAILLNQAKDVLLG